MSVSNPFLVNGLDGRELPFLFALDKYVKNLIDYRMETLLPDNGSKERHDDLERMKKETDESRRELFETIKQGI